MKIQISGQYGEPRASDIFWPMQKKLNECFEKNIKGGYLKTILKFAIGFRVSGKLCDFQSQGAERLRYLKKTNALTVDLVFSESQWSSADLDELKKVIVIGVLKCLDLMIVKSEKLGELVEREALLSDIEKSLDEFLQ